MISLFVGIATMYWSCRHEIIMCRWMAGQFSFGETEVCNMHVHVLFFFFFWCVHILFYRRTIALLFPNPTSASLAIPRVRVATAILRIVPFIPNDSHKKLDMRGEWNRICPHNWYIGSLSYHSWPRGPNSLTIRAGNQGLQNIFVTSSSWSF